MSTKLGTEKNLYNKLFDALGTGDAQTMIDFISGKADGFKPILYLTVKSPKRF